MELLLTTLTAAGVAVGLLGLLVLLLGAVLVPLADADPAPRHRRGAA